MLRDLPMHNLNRGADGLPKSQFDGGIQRARLSSQSIKKPARTAFRAAVSGLADAPASIRTMDSNAAKIVTETATQLAAGQGREFDAKAALKTATAVIRGLAKKGAVKEEEAGAKSSQGPSGESSSEKNDKKDNILLFSDAELDTLAQALVDAQHDAAESSDDELRDRFIQDFKSPSLDIAAFGRMFAEKAQKSTQAAIAVSHAVTTHEMSLTIDYFTAVDEHDDEEREDAGAAHLGLAYYTSGTYYSTFTIDADQLARSWSGINSPSAREQLVALITSLIRALPTGKLTNTNAHTLPFLVLAEEQRARTVYDFETPVVAKRDGGYRRPSLKALASQYALAREFDPGNYGESLLLVRKASEQGDGAFSDAQNVATVEAFAEQIADRVLAGSAS